ncbi:MAG: DNA topoisomerase VI subunit B, partial [Elusimicrobia bacterium]|nr:DNA topoisomerase VI subunit B [Elusimicrobiota bacterium]
NPFVIEVGLAFGKHPELQAAAAAAAEKKPLAEGETHDDDDNELARVIRFANRVPLLYQQSACSTFKAVLDTTWKNYGVSQSRGAPPAGPMVVMVHMASVWVPFTSESKEAIADYDEIRKEITLGMREAGRRLGVFLNRRERAHHELKRSNIFELYIEEVVSACKSLKGGKIAEKKLKEQLIEIANKRTGGQLTDDLTEKSSAPAGLPHSIIVTPEGIEGEIPVEAPAEPGTAETSVAAPAPAAAEAPAPEEPKTAKASAKKGKAKAKAKPAPKKAKAKAKSKPAKKKGKR